jgi:CDGSH-type Zn-finger protein
VAPSVKIIENGPLRVTGAPLYRLRPVNNDAGRPVDWQRGDDVETAESFSLCRCGASENKPFCDGTHNSMGFNGHETADRTPSATRREHYEGPGIVMTDDKTLCYHAGFCVREHAKAWSLVERADDAEARTLLVDMIEKCPSGRLEYFEPPDETPVERALEQQVGIVDDGPLWVQGGIPVQGSDGEPCEVRNRVTLCRCGASKNKPFCDGEHSKIDFKDS